MSSEERRDDGITERKALSRRDLLGVAAGAAAALTLGSGMRDGADRSRERAGRRRATRRSRSHATVAR